MRDKFPEQARTFGTRLEFIRRLFANKYSQYEIMTGCVQHKLDRSFLSYAEELHASVLDLSAADPLRVLKNID